MNAITIIDGRDIEQLSQQLAEMVKDGPVQVKLSGKKARSLSQNALSHMWYSEVSRWLIGKGKDFATPEWCKAAMKNTFLGVEDVFHTDVVTGVSTRRQELRHTSKLDVGEMKLYLDLVYHWCLDRGLMLTIPEGCQYQELCKRENGIDE
jgi:hypothetical protein